MRKVLGRLCSSFIEEKSEGGPRNLLEALMLHKGWENLWNSSIVGILLIAFDLLEIIEKYDKSILLSTMKSFNIECLIFSKENGY